MAERGTRIEDQIAVELRAQQDHVGHGERPVPAFVRDVDVPGVTRQVSVRLITLGAATPADTVSAEAMVDLDSQGEVIG